MATSSARRLAPAALVVLAAGGATGWVASAASPSAAAHEARRHPGGDRHGRDRGGGDPGATTTQTTTAAQPTPTVASTTTTTTTTGTAAPTAGASAGAAAPQLGRSVALATASGSVLIRVPGGVPTPLAASGAPLPTGTRVDARFGEVVLTSAIDARGTTRTGRFHGGIFEVRQRPGGRGVTELILVGGHWGACPARRRRAAAARARAAAVATAARRRRPIRRLWGSDDHGRFATRGAGSVATVRGTRWLTEDFCDGTRTTVSAGAVLVRSRRTGRTVLVRAGHSLLVPR